jgi:hypothetical protein
MKQDGILQEFNRIWSEVQQQKISHPYDIDVYRYVFDQALEFALKQQKVATCALTEPKTQPTIQTSKPQQKEITMNNISTISTENDQVPFPSFFLLDDLAEMIGFDSIAETRLNQSELQTLQFVLRTILNSLTEDRAYLNRAAKVLYTKCDPEVPESEEYFDLLNNTRDGLRKSTQFYKSLASIQNKIKRMQKEI